MGTKEISSGWVEKLEKALAQAGRLPSLGEEFPFPWQEASGAIGKSLQVPDFKISCTHKGWKNSSELLRGMSDRAFLTAVEISPIEGRPVLALSENGVSEFISHMSLTTLPKEGLFQAKLKEGFYTFLFLKILQALDSLHLFKNGSLSLSSSSLLPDEEAFCIDIEVAFLTKSVQGRVICPRTFVEAFKNYQPFQKETLLSYSMELPLRCEVGYTLLSQEDFSKIQVGDFVILDKCSYDPSHEKGSVTLLLGKTPLLLARLKAEGIKILEFAISPEEPVEEGVTLIAEIEPLHLPLQQLLHIEPGILLDHSLHPEHGVFLTIDEKKVGQGELLKLGDLLGIRILEITHE